MTSPQDVQQQLLQLQGTMYDGRAAMLFSAASTWAYSDLECFASMLSHCGLYGEFVSVNVTNDAAYIDTTAYLFLSDDKKLAILTFKGPDPDNTIAWFSNANAQMQIGVQGEFLAGNIVVLPLLKDLLLGWSETSTSLADSLVWIRDNRPYPDAVFPSDEELFPKGAKAQQSQSKKKSSKKSGRSRDESRADAGQDRALFVCGHGLGGAFASMFGALLYCDRNLEPLRDELRSIYTFGAPMFAPKPFADALDMNLGTRVFRHRFGRDPVPLLSVGPRGWLEHFGQSYRCSWMRAGWVPAGRFIDNVYGPMMANMFGVTALVKERMTMLQWLRMPFVWADHLPFRYMRTSMAMRAGSELFIDGFTTDYPGSDEQ